MSYAESLEILQNHKDIIITKWYNDIIEHYPGFHDLEKLMNETHSYYQFMLELDVPMEEHERYLKIPHLCEHFFERNISCTHIIHSNQLWIDAFLWFVQEKEAAKVIPLSLIRKIIYRVNTYERSFLNHYDAITRKLLVRQEQAITDLHEARLSVIGKMAASMAHEIRNPLTTILGFLKIMRRQVSDEKLSSYFDLVENEFQNIQMQITGFLSFSKKEIVEEPYIKLSTNALIKSVIALISPRLINDNIDFQFTEGKDVQLRIQKIAVQQVLSNILNNSMDALAESEGYKKLSVTTQASPEKYVISVSNNGPEIPVEIHNSLFAPFVTNKKEGTGLGLAICKQIMTKNGGDVTFTSNAEETTFYIEFQLQRGL